MTKVLIHYSSGDGPIGLWKQKEDGSLESYYLPSVSKTWKKRGSDIVNNKGENSSYDEFFSRLCDHSAYQDHFGITEAGLKDPLEAVMYKLRKEQVTNQYDNDRLSNVTNS